MFFEKVIGVNDTGKVEGYLIDFISVIADNGFGFKHSTIPCALVVGRDSLLHVCDFKQIKRISCDSPLKYCDLSESIWEIDGKQVKDLKVCETVIDGVPVSCLKANGVTVTDNFEKVKLTHVSKKYLNEFEGCVFTCEDNSHFTKGKPLHSVDTALVMLDDSGEFDNKVLIEK